MLDAKKKLILPILENKRNKRIIRELYGPRKSASYKKSHFKEDAFQKGYKFESFVVRRFDPEYFTLVEWRSDKSTEDIRPVMSMYPDLELFFEWNDQELYFAVECKWRECFSNDTIYLGDNQPENYQRYQQVTGYPTFLILGVGNTPENPNSVYIVPISHVEKSTLHEFDLRKFKRQNPLINFFLDAKAIFLK